MTSETKYCVACNNVIPSQATRCSFCHSDQQPTRTYGGLISVLSLVVAIIAILPQTVGNIRSEFFPPEPSVQVLRIFTAETFDNLALGEGLEIPDLFWSAFNDPIIDGWPAGVALEVMNLGTEPIVLSPVLKCKLEIPLEYAPERYEIVFTNSKSYSLSPKVLNTMVWGDIISSRVDREIADPVGMVTNLTKSHLFRGEQLSEDGRVTINARIAGTIDPKGIIEDPAPRPSYVDELFTGEASDHEFECNVELQGTRSTSSVLSFFAKGVF